MSDQGKIHILRYEKQCWLQFCNEEPTGPHLAIAIAIPYFGFESWEEFDEDADTPGVLSDISPRFLVLLNMENPLMWVDNSDVYFTEKAAAKAYEAEKSEAVLATDG